MMAANQLRVHILIGSLALALATGVRSQAPPTVGEAHPGVPFGKPLSASAGEALYWETAASVSEDEISSSFIILKRPLTVTKKGITLEAGYRLDETRLISDVDPFTGEYSYTSHFCATAYNKPPFSELPNKYICVDDLNGDGKIDKLLLRVREEITSHLASHLHAIFGRSSVAKSSN